jgi:transcription elongation factor GreA
MNEGKDTMETQDVFLTDSGRERALHQLEFLRTVKRAEVAQYLHDAKESGDVIDNAAYEDAKNEQARLEGRIFELEQLLAKAKLINHVRTDVVSLGSVVHLCTSDDREYKYTIVGAFDARPSAGYISNESPVGKALLNHKVGDMVIVSTPGGVKEYTILAIS